MDPVPLTVSCLALVATIGKVTSTTAEFVRQYRDARNDVRTLDRELNLIKEDLELLSKDAKDEGWFGSSDMLGRRIAGILEGCNLVIKQIPDFLADYRGAFRMDWLVLGRKEAAKLQRCLGMHRFALDIALDIVNLSIARELINDTDGIQIGMDAVQSDASRILVEIAELKGQLDHRCLPNALALERLERFLDDSSTYAETAYEASMYDSEALFLPTQGYGDINPRLPTTPQIKPKARERRLPGPIEAELVSLSSISTVVLPSPADPGTPVRPRRESDQSPTSSWLSSSGPTQTISLATLNGWRPPRPESSILPSWDMERAEESSRMSGTPHQRYTHDDLNRSGPTGFQFPFSTTQSDPDAINVDAWNQGSYDSVYPIPVDPDEPLDHKRSKNKIIDPAAISSARRAREELTPSDQTKLDQKLKKLTKDMPLSKVHSMLAEGADPNSTIDACTPSQTFAVYEAVLHSRTDILRLLLSYGANPNLHSKGSNAMPPNTTFLPLSIESFGFPLQAAAARCDSSALDHLLAAGAAINTSSGFYGTATQASAAKGERGFVCLNLLLKAGADPNIPLGYFYTPLQAASRAAHLPSIQKLLEAGADPSPERPGGPFGTPLHAATAGGHVEAVRLLLEAGANKTMKARCGWVERSVMGGRDVSELISAEDMVPRIQKGGKAARQKLMALYDSWRR